MKRLLALLESIRLCACKVVFPTAHGPHARGLWCARCAGACLAVTTHERQLSTTCAMQGTDAFRACPCRRTYVRWRAGHPLPAAGAGDDDEATGNGAALGAYDSCAGGQHGVLKP